MGDDDNAGTGDLNTQWRVRRTRLVVVFTLSLVVSLAAAVLSSNRIGLGAVGYLAMMLLLLAGIGLVVYAIAGIARHRVRPPALAVAGGGFVPVPVAATIGYAACAGLAWAFPAVQLVALYELAADPTGDGSLGDLLTAELGVTVFIAAIAVMIARMTFRVFRGLMRVRLRPDGLEVPTPAGTAHLIRWQTMRGPVRPTEPTRRLRLDLDRPARARLGLMYRHVDLDIAALDVHPWFLVDVLRYYVEHPEQRAAIGTQAGYERMRADVFAVAPR